MQSANDWSGQGMRVRWWETRFSRFSLTCLGSSRAAATHGTGAGRFFPQHLFFFFTKVP